MSRPRKSLHNSLRLFAAGAGVRGPTGNSSEKWFEHGKGHPAPESRNFLATLSTPSCRFAGVSRPPPPLHNSLRLFAAGAGVRGPTGKSSEQWFEHGKGPPRVLGTGICAPGFARLPGVCVAEKGSYKSRPRSPPRSKLLLSCAGHQFPAGESSGSLSNMAYRFPAGPCALIVVSPCEHSHVLLAAVSLSNLRSSDSLRVYGHRAGVREPTGKSSEQWFEHGKGPARVVAVGLQTRVTSRTHS